MIGEGRKNAREAMIQELLDTKGAAKFLNVPKQYIYQHPEIPRCRLGGRLRFDPEELLNWVKRHRKVGDEIPALHRNSLYR
jgi:hypothetical protein